MRFGVEFAPYKRIHTSRNMIIKDTETIDKEIPNVIRNEILTALAHYPELETTRIRFKFTRSLNGSIMAARPQVSTLFGARKNRMYDILMSPVFKLTSSIEPIHQVDPNVLIGWIGHELGHIMDYEQRSTLGIARFGLLYWLSKTYIRKAERVADTFAVHRGMASYILATKNFILNHSGLSQKYKDKIASLYLSPDDIVQVVEEMQQRNTSDKEEILMEEAEISTNLEQQEQESR